MMAMNFSKTFSNSIKYFSSKALPSPQLNPKLPTTKLYLNNEWVDSLQPGNTITAINPTTAQPIADVPQGCKEDLDRAVEAAKKAFHYTSPWRKMSGLDRAKLLWKFADLIERDAVYLASLDTLEIGKLYSATLLGDIPYAVDVTRHSAGWCDKNIGKVLKFQNHFAYSVYEPVGVCGLILAWNFPMMLNTTKLISSLATGNVAILKPSKNAIFSLMHLIELTKEVGFPPGVIGMVPGTSEIGQMMCEHPDIDLISFTGSTETGQDVYRRGAINMKRNVLELGGKSPIVIFDDANLDLAVQTASTAVFHNAGQCCCAGSRTYVQETIFEEFLEKSKEITRKRKIGNPFDQTTMHGPQAHEGHLNNILRMVELGKKEGATLEMGGVRCDGKGFFMEPAIFTGVKDEMVISQEEIFGPVQLISPFKTMDEVIERANNTKYGLASSIFSKDVDKINTFSKHVRAGNVWVNSYFAFHAQVPFGGYKMSGIGKESGLSGLEQFVEEKCVSMKQY